MATNALKGSFAVEIPNAATYLHFRWTVTGQEGMNSIISWTLVSDYRSYWYSASLSGTYSVNINGTNLVSISSFSESKLDWQGDAYRERILRSGTYILPRSILTNTADFNVTITANGTLTRKKYGETSEGTPSSEIVETKTFSHNTSSSREYIVYSTTTYGSGAQVTAVSDFTDETNPTITYIYDRGSQVDSVTLEAAISFTGATDDIPYRAISATETSYTFELTGTERSKLWELLDNGTTASVRFYIRTTEVVDGETLYVYNFLTKAFKFVNYHPVITTASTDIELVEDINSDTLRLTGDKHTLVRYFSTAHINAQAVARKGATIASEEVRNGTVTKNTFDTIIENVSSNTFYFSATDNRGYSTNKAAVFNNLGTLKWIDYIKLTCNMKNEPMGADGVLVIHVTGKYFNGNFGAAPNRLTLEYEIHDVNGAEGAWIPLGNEGVVEPTVDEEGNYSYSFEIQNLDYKGRYNVRVRASDELMPGYSESNLIISATPIFDWDKDDFNFNVPVNLGGGFSYPQRMIWTGTSQLGADDTIELEGLDTIENQPSGIVLVFSLYRDGAAADASIQSFFVSKVEANTLLSGTPHMFMLGINSNLSVFGSKYVYISNNRIRGFEGNTNSGTAACGITFNNSSFVLRYILGV